MAAVALPSSSVPVVRPWYGSRPLASMDLLRDIFSLFSRSSDRGGDRTKDIVDAMQPVRQNLTRDGTNRAERGPSASALRSPAWRP
jgi:hypothetical protein